MFNEFTVPSPSQLAKTTMEHEMERLKVQLRGLGKAGGGGPVGQYYSQKADSKISAEKDSVLLFSCPSALIFPLVSGTGSLGSIPSRTFVLFLFLGKELLLIIAGGMEGFCAVHDANPSIIS
jgi:hypothetical protein